MAEPLNELYVVALAREISDGMRLHVGANQPDVMLAALLARRLWAPRLRVVMLTDFLLHPPQTTHHLDRRCYAPALVEARRASFQQASPFDDLLRTPTMFGGGLQIDRRGNANLTGIRSGSRYKLRGPGSAGLPTLTSTASTFFIACPRHDAKSLVDRVDEVSILGDPVARRALGLKPRSLQAVITPLASFAPSDDGLVLTEITAGVDLSDVQRATGFPLRTDGIPALRRPVAPEEHSAMAELCGPRTRATVTV
jgi:glutaconate CoA-transferase subunit B